ncbi:bifunctional DNA-formamidopyrimidine glycosylase/DNA-(apurinic or apyrimidinic site) lyase [Corticibacter populi]|uniref:Formamidopyrimidine-DNA glycosylase n=1 Tax=Corticibacter populi TaxID=1550736 RepID=A0A3M6QTS6_9BURK|nr:bifunctional DNA-formamidopyrimidine glycosylase/DNA-(apurinic or apyrimidinic site) lyase [Corticibacter populi]RMX06383.1 bifunctional DNA-formamidopyrimidine glycosylase/DNA-(apurinic or apyrimidinic site) lyase [Corticibacter populi]RZS32071.1 DNA-(apurinic or apyrimidinic site) lyase [Corticibacter populi]
MPELPEVEVTRLGIAPAVTGQRLEALRLGKPLRWPLGCAPEQLAGSTIEGVRRRGKYLLFDLDGGRLLMLHLGMSGSVRILPRNLPFGPHDHVDMVFAGYLLRLHDPRRFGALVFAESADAPLVRKLLAGLGVEPLSEDFTVEALARGLRQRSLSIKQALLAGDVVVGVGNIYASEALFLAGIRPTTPAGKISRLRLARLHAAIVQVLSEAVRRGGSSLRDFTAADGSHGHFQLSANVYGRQGQPCRQCGSPIRQIVQGQRSTYYCPHCQR